MIVSERSSPSVRAGPDRNERVYRFGPFTIDVSGRLLLAANRTFTISERPFRLLLMLLEANGNVVSRDRMLASVWPGGDRSQANLTQHMFLLRRILDDAGGSGPYVLTIPGVGYRLRHAVERKDALQMKEACERCNAALEGMSEAFICSYECTYCAACAKMLFYECTNCGGELCPRPRRGRLGT